LRPEDQKAPAPSERGRQWSAGKAADAVGLDPASILLGLGPITLGEAVDALVPKALHGAGKAFQRGPEIAADLRQAMRQSALEFHRGLALLHARVADLTERRLALGVSNEGIATGDAAQERVFAVLVSLIPAGRPGYDIPLWARKTLCSERTIYQLRKAQDAAEVLRILKGP
jgi:mannitol/fructose-specific phosphotransferase system IIA component (Ntr-type)